MGDGTHIEWTDATWPIVQGCDYESPGCTHCYVPRTLWRLMHNPNPIISEPIAGLVRKHDNGMPVFTGNLALREDRLDWPLHWKKPRRIFVPSHGDLFHEGVPDSFIDKVFAAMAMAPQHTYQVLTKRAPRMREYICAKIKNAPEWVYLAHIEGKVLLPYEGGVPKRIWLGVSVEDQQRADERIPELLATPAAIRFLSCEPLLGPVDLFHIKETTGFTFNALSRKVGISFRGIGVDWIIAGNESGPRRRPGDLAWMRSLRDQCAAAGVAFFGKQDDKVKPLPDDLMIRQFPTPKEPTP
jgi:protein gp37